MEYLEFFLYGLIQGLTEFIPVSSTAHLKVISLFLGVNDPGPSLSAIIQFGSVLALGWYFRNDFFKWRSKSSNRFFNYLLHDAVKANYWLVIGTYRQGPGGRPEVSGITTVSYTHLTLPTICSV